jgi:hypothetical protein
LRQNVAVQESGSRPKANLNRRQFLGTAGAIAAGAAAPLILPRSMVGASAPSDRVTLGFIGTGRQAMGMNIPEFLAVPGVQVVAVCDVDSWRLGEAKKLVEAYYATRTPAGVGASKFKDVAGYADKIRTPILLQDHNTVAWFRSLKIRALPGR